MNTAEKIYEEASKLPEHLAKEVLDYLKYIEKNMTFRLEKYRICKKLKLRL